MLTALRLFTTFSVLLLALILGGPALAFPVGNAAGLADGAGVWVNLWNYPDADLDMYCANLTNHGVRNLFVQTGRSNTGAVAHPDKLGPLIEACHRHHIRIIGWAFSDLANQAADADKLIQVGRFESPSGHRLDGIAADLEINLAAWKVENFSQKLRAELGAGYPMIAVVYSPLNGAAQAVYTPWHTLSKYWDVIAPMTYWSGKHQKLDAYTYTSSTIEKVRKLAGRADIEVHPIGDGMHSTITQFQQFLKACRDKEAAGASLYPNQKPDENQLSALSRYSDYFEANSRFRLAAFRELTKSGKIPQPLNGDPSQLIPRSEFYCLLVRHLYAVPNSAVTSKAALDTLIELGLVEDDLDAATLSQPISSPEALSLIAEMMQSQGRVPGHTRPRRQADSWLVQPAHAEISQSAPQRTNNLNYLDAAQLVLQSGAGLRYSPGIK